MLIINVKEGENIDRALKRFKRKVRDTKQVINLRDKKQFDLLLHDVHKSPEEILFCREARAVYAATSELRDRLADVRPDALASFAPGAPVIIQPPKFDLTLITFGMAHKIRSERYQKLGEL